MSEPLLSAAQGSSSSIQLGHCTSNATSPTNERRASHVSSGDYLQELGAVLADLEQQHAAVAASSTANPARHGDTLSPPTAQSLSATTLERRQLGFLQGARRFMDLIQMPVLRGILEKASQSEAQPSTAYEVIYEHDMVRNVKSPSLPPLLEQYYDAAGEVKLQGEVLVDLDYRYAEELSVRLLQEDQGVELLVPDDLFHEEYLRKRAFVEMQLEQKISKANDLRAACIDAGLDLAAGFRQLDDSEEDVSAVLVEHYEDDLHSLSDPGLIQQPLEVGSTDRLRSGGLTPAARSMLGLVNMQDHVFQWMADLETTGDEHPQRPFSVHSQDRDDNDEEYSMNMEHGHLGHENASPYNHGARRDDEHGRREELGLVHDITVPTRAARPSVTVSAAFSWVDISKQEVEEAIGRFEELDLATAPSLNVDYRAHRRGRDRWGEDTRDTNSTTTPRTRWGTLLNASFAELRAWVSRYLSPAQPTP
nr:hypothetical protein B0A51_03185 [Rachicladosporium sp. CCFEE 5018]